MAQKISVGGWVEHPSVFFPVKWQIQPGGKWWETNCTRLQIEENKNIYDPEKLTYSHESWWLEDTISF